MTRGPYKRSYQGHYLAVAPSRCPVLAPRLAPCRQQRSRAAARLLRRRLVCVCTHTEMYKHTQEKKAEKYVNLKHLATVLELTSLVFGLLFNFFFFCWGVKQGRQACHLGLGKEGA